MDLGAGLARGGEAECGGERASCCDGERGDATMAVREGGGDAGDWASEDGGGLPAAEARGWPIVTRVGLSGGEPAELPPRNGDPDMLHRPTNTDGGDWGGGWRLASPWAVLSG